MMEKLGWWTIVIERLATPDEVRHAVGVTLDVDPTLVNVIKIIEWDDVTTDEAIVCDISRTHGEFLIWMRIHFQRIDETEYDYLESVFTLGELLQCRLLVEPGIPANNEFVWWLIENHTYRYVIIDSLRYELNNEMIISQAGG